MSKGTTSQDAPFGTLLGYAPGGVAIYSSDYSSPTHGTTTMMLRFAAISTTNTWAINGSASSSRAVFSFSTMA